ncbi:uncharacterized protein LOC128239836 [Mya arenaria]|uniref:uncharacterized protein LOC128239836 n=1 Tax=Mya arenaria TaxID=6604 RepID=UPI0022E86951|nr:uncharacterized protein LOC128239836 [Mya arenaria]
MQGLSSIIFTLLTFFVTSTSTQKIVLQGNVYIEGVFTVYENEAGGCGKTLPFSVQHIEAVTWQLRKLNNRVGLRVWATCGSLTRARQIAYNITQQLDEVAPDTLAVLGPENSEEAEVVSRLLGALPASVRPLHISFSADGDVFTDRVAFNNFFRVIPPETATVESVAKFLSEMFWTYVAVFHDNSTQSLSRLEYLKELVMSNGIITCFPRVFVRNGEALANVEDDLKGIYEADKRINGVLILGDVELWQTVSAAIDSKVASTNSSYERPVVLFITDTYLSLQATEDPSVSEKGLYIASPRTIEVTPFTEGWTELLTNSTNGTSYVHTMMEQHHAAQCKAVVSEVCRAKALKLFPPSVHSPYAILATLLISNVFQTKCPSFERSCLNSTGRHSLVTSMENSFGFEFRDFSSLLRFSFQSDSPEIQISHISDKFYGSVIYNKVRSSNTPPKWQFVEALEYSTQTKEYIFRSGNIRQYTTNGTEHIYPDVLRPECPDGRQCTECPMRESPPIDVTEGDMYIVGIVPVHTTSGNALQCGNVKQGGVDVAESIKATVLEAKNKYSNEIPNANIGVIIIDSCNDPQVVAARLLELLNQGIYENGGFKKVRSNILGYIGGWTSDNSMQVASILTRIKSVQVSYGSTSPALSNRNQFPFFMRMIPNDLYQGQKMIEIVKKLGSNLIQVLYSDTAYGRGGKDAVISQAVAHNICVGQVVMVEQKSDVDLDAIVSELEQENMPKIIMVYLSSFDVVKLIGSLKTMKGFIFIASEGWGNRDIIANADNLEGSITLAHELRIPEYINEHIEEISKAEKKSAWLTEYMEDYFDCYYEWSFDKTKGDAKCSPSQYLEADNCFRVTPDQRCFKVETWSPFAAIGVETLLKGAKLALNELCNGNTSTICEEYLRQPEVLMKHVLKQKFAVSGTSLKQVYNVTSHDGLIDLNTYQIKKDDKGVYYDQLEEGWVYAFRESTCDKIDNPECSICFKDPTTTPSPPPADNSKQSYMTATFVTASFCCMLVMVLIITMCKVVQGRRKRAARRQIYLTPTMGDDGYLSTNDVQRMSSVGDFPGGIFNKDVNISDESNNTPPQGHASNTSLNNLNNSCNPPPPYLGPAQQNKYV